VLCEQAQDLEACSEMSSSQKSSSHESGGSESERNEDQRQRAFRHRQLRRNEKIAKLVMHPDHKHGIAVWQDSEGVQHACAPLSCRQQVVQAVVDALEEMDQEADVVSETVNSTLKAPEDAVSGLLNRKDLIQVLRILEWKTVHEEWKDGRSVPAHMAMYRNAEEWWAPVRKVPCVKNGVWPTEGDALQNWKAYARSLLDMTAWIAGDAARPDEYIAMRDVLGVSGRDLKAGAYHKLVACLGICLNWYHAGSIIGLLVSHCRSPFRSF